MSEPISQERLDRATWRALARAFRIAEEALAELGAWDVLERMRAEVEACQ